MRPEEDLAYVFTPIFIMSLGLELKVRLLERLTAKELTISVFYYFYLFFLMRGVDLKPNRKVSRLGSK
jgi:Kef-type K+ transport system membrane component KefB